MNAAMLSDWENIIGNEKVRLISTKFFDNRLYCEFPNLGKNDYAHKKTVLVIICARILC